MFQCVTTNQATVCTSKRRTWWAENRYLLQNIKQCFVWIFSFFFKLPRIRNFHIWVVPNNCWMCIWHSLHLGFTYIKLRMSLITITITTRCVLYMGLITITIMSFHLEITFLCVECWIYWHLFVLVIDYVSTSWWHLQSWRGM